MWRGFNQKKQQNKDISGKWNQSNVMKCAKNKTKKKTLSKVLQSGNDIIVGGTKNVNSFDFFCSYFPNK